MNQFSGTNSSSIHPTATQDDDLVFEGVAANIKLLLKLVEDHKQYGCNNRKTLRVATMLTILDNVRTRIQGSSLISKDDDDGGDEKLEMMRLKREVKSLKVMCTSLGKEKDIIAAELSKKVQEFTGMEELVNDIRTQNEALLRKVREYSCDKSSSLSSSSSFLSLGELQALKERNKVMSEQLLKSLEGYRRMKRNLRAAQEENVRMNEMWAKAAPSVDRIKTGDGGKEEIVALEGTVEWFRKRGNGVNIKKPTPKPTEELCNNNETNKVNLVL